MAAPTTAKYVNKIREVVFMTKAFAICLAIGLVLMWITLSTEHGKIVGKEIKRIIKEFVKGRKKD